jgi:L-rhamnose isomerase
VIGTRTTIMALLAALLEPAEILRAFEQAGNHTARLALLEEIKTLPLGAVWDEYCRRHDTPIGPAWLDEVNRYESAVLNRR